VGTKEELHAISGRSKAELEETYLALTSEESDVSMQRQVQQG